MKKPIFLFLIVLTSFPCLFSQGWHLVSVPGRADSGQGNCNTPPYATGFGSGGHGYAGTGKNNFWRYDPVQNIWKDIDLPATVRTEATGFAMEGKGYFGFGNNNGDLWQMDTTTGAWIQMANDPGPAPLGSYGALVIGDSAYLGYGNNFYRFCPSNNTWLHKRPFPGSETSGSTLLTLNGVGYYIGGQANDPYEVWAYDAGRDTFIQKNDMNNYYYNGATPIICGGFVSNNRLYIFIDISGLNSGLIEVNEYNDATDSWSIVSVSPPNIFKGNYVVGDPYSHFSFSIGTKGYIGGEYTGVYGLDPSFWEYDPDLNLWTQKASFAQSNNSVPLTATIDSVAYVFGGGFDTDASSTALWSYNGNTGVWTQKASFPGLARIAPLGFAIDTLLYAGGGYGILAGPLTDFWQYSPATDTWTQKDSLPTGLFPAASGQYGGGAAIGGYGYYNNYRYDPVVDTWSSVTYFDFAGGTPAVSGNNIFNYLPSTSILTTGDSNSVTSYNPITNTSAPSYFTIPGPIVDTILDYVQPYDYNALAIPEWNFARGGKVDFLYGNLFLEYDTLTLQWKKLPDFPGIVNQDATSFVIGNKIYYGFGDTGSYRITYNKLWEYDDNYTPPNGINEVGRVDIKLYPNPVTNEFTIQSDIFTQTLNISSHIFDIDGREYRIPSQKVGNTINFDAGDLPAGVYTIRINIGGQQWTKKIVKLGLE